MHPVKYILLILSPFAFYAIWIACWLSGNLDVYLEDSIGKEFTGTRYTGIAIIDEQIPFVTLAYWIITEGDVFPMTLKFFSVYATFISAWNLYILEVCLSKPPKTVLKRILVPGLVWMLVTVGPVLPIYLALDFPSEPILANNDAISQNLIFINGLPGWSLVFYYLPLFLTCLSAPHAIAPNMKQHAIIALNLWALWISAAAGLSWLVYRNKQESRASASSNVQIQAAYRFTFASAVFSHLVSTLAPIIVNGGLNWRVESILSDLGQMFDLPSPWSPRVASTAVDVCMYLWHWDLATCVTPLFIWAMVIYVREVKRQHLKVNYVRLSVEVLGHCVLIGPCAVSVNLLMKRNELIGINGGSRGLKKTM